MAKRQITIDDGSKGREQVALNLNPVALTPTVNSNGGNYRVAVQQTPLTNSAMELSKSLKQGVAAYGQAVEIGTKKGAEDAANMSDEDYDKFLQKGLDPEAKSLFGHTKAYNRKLSERYYATEIPTKLAALSSDMFKNYYDYKDPAAFEAALEARTGEVYAEADELLGGNVFGEQANNVLKAATRASFIGNEVEKFNRELPRRNQEMATETIGRQLADVDDTNIDSLFTIATKAFDGNVGILGKKAAAGAVFSSMQTRLETLIASDSSSDHDIADAIFDEIGGGKDEEKLVAGQELFATPERQLKLAELEKKLETRVEGSFRDAQKDAAVYSNAIQADLIGIDDEGKAAIMLDTKIKELTRSGSIDGEKLENGKSVDMLIIDLNKLKSNPYLFRQQHEANYIAQHSVNKSLMDNTMQTLLDTSAEAGDGLYMERLGGMQNSKAVLTAQGTQLMADYNLKSTQMYAELYASVAHIKDDEERRMAFVEKERAEILPAMQTWLDKATNNTATNKRAQESTERQELVNEHISPEEQQKIEAISVSPDELRVLQDSIIQEKRDEAAVGTFLTARDGSRSLVDYNGPILRRSYANANKFDMFDTAEEKVSAHAQLVEYWNESQGFRLPAPRTNTYQMYSTKPWFGKKDLVEKAAERTKIRKLHSLYGVNSKELLSDLVTGFPSVTVTEMYGGKLRKEDFSTFPIIIGGNLQKTIDTVQSYFLEKEKDTLDTDFFVGDYAKIAEKYELSIDELMTAQRAFLQREKFITD